MLASPVYPAQGSLAAGQSVQVTAEAESGSSFYAYLSVNPGGQTVMVVYRGHHRDPY